MTIKSSISLTDDQHAFARALVEEGRFASMSAVLQQGVGLLRQQMEKETLECAALAEVLAERRSGSFVPGPGMDDRLASMIARKCQADAVRDRVRVSVRARSGADFRSSVR